MKLNFLNSRLTSEFKKISIRISRKRQLDICSTVIENRYKVYIKKYIYEFEIKYLKIYNKFGIN